MLHLTRLVVLAILVAQVCGLGGCSRSRAEMLRDRSATVERKLELERNRVLTEGEIANSGRGGRDGAISHLQTLRGALSLVNVSIASVPLLLTEPDQREIGYSVLDEAIGTIDWNIPIYSSSGTGGAGSAAKAFPTLFSPQTGLDFSAIKQGNGPRGIAK